MNEPFEIFLQKSKDEFKMFEYYMKKIIKRYTTEQNTIDNILTILKQFFALRFFLIQKIDHYKMDWQISSVLYNVLNISNNFDEILKMKYIDAIIGITKNENIYNYFKFNKIVPSMEEHENMIKNDEYVNLISCVIYEKISILTQNDKCDIDLFFKTLIRYINIYEDYNMLNDNGGKQYKNYCPNYLITLLNQKKQIDDIIDNNGLIITQLEEHNIFDVVFDEIQHIANSDIIKKFIHRKELEVYPINRHINNG